MNRRIFIVLLFFPFLLTCRNSLMELSNEKASLSIGVSINRSLYSGNVGQDPARFIDLSSESLSLTYTAGDREYTTTAALKISAEDPDKLTAKTTLQNLPANIPGTISVETFNKNGILVCDRHEEMELSDGENKVTLTLRISPDSPLLTSFEQSSYLITTLPAGETRFIRMGPFEAGQEYYFAGASFDGTDPDVSSHLVSEEGDLIAFTEKVDQDGLFFTPSAGEEYAVFSFLNTAATDLNVYLWWDEAHGYSQLVKTDRINLTGLNNIGIYSLNPIPMASAGGRFYMSSQNISGTGVLEYTDNGTSWTSLDASSLVDSSITSLSPLYNGVAAITADSGYLFGGLFYMTGSVGPDTFYLNLGIRDRNGSFNYTPSHPSPINYADSSLPHLKNIRITHSSSHIALASVDTSGTLYLSMTDLYPGSVGSFSNIVSGAFDISAATDNLSIAALQDECYILGSSGNIYKYVSGSSSLSSVPVSSINVNASSDRHLSSLNDRYLIASSTEESAVYLPDSNEKIVLYDDNNRPEDLQLFWDSGFTTVDFHMFASQGMLIAVTNLFHPSTYCSFSIALSPDGGISWIDSGITTLPGMTAAQIIDAVYDSSLGEVYLEVLEDQGNLMNNVYTFQLQ